MTNEPAYEPPAHIFIMNHMRNRRKLDATKRSDMIVQLREEHLDDDMKKIWALDEDFDDICL